MTEVNSEQAAQWNASGHGWARVQDTVDVILRPFQDMLVETARAEQRRRVLDIGCGTGGVTRAIAEATGADCVGVDIAKSMIEAARQQGQAEFLVADAQVHVFEERFDLVVSRFGVMFFDDPVAAFANLLRSSTPGADLCFVTWRGAEENPFMLTAQRAAAALFPDQPERDPDGPGPFSLTDADWVRKLLGDGGWGGIEVTPVDLTCTLPEDALEPYLRNLGPVSRALTDADPADRDRIIDQVRRAFDHFVDGDVVSFPTATWRITASAPL